jgi:hypothetical protein
MLREEHRLRIFQNRVLRGIFGHKRDEVTGGWRKLHNEKLHNFYSSPNIITVIKSRRMRLDGHEVRRGEIRNAYKILTGMHEGRSLGRPRCTWEDNIKIDLWKIWFGGVGWIHLAQDKGR